MDAAAIVELFDDLTDRLEAELEQLDDWSLVADAHESQYRHDQVADELVVPVLTDAGFRVLTEESGITGSGEITVVVDPVDGSTNASRKLPWYATSLCAVDAEGPLAALVANLALGERYRAVRGEGAESTGVTLQPSGCTELGEAIVAFSGLPEDRDRYAQARMYGAGALDLCAVAAGRFDAYVDMNGAHGVWDYLGAQLVLAECGIEMVDAYGRETCVLSHEARRGPITAATPELLEQVIAMAADWGVAHRR